MELRFCKMEGCGNDYIYVDAISQQVEHPQQLAVQMADRHFGVGADGLILILPSETADARMQTFNADGSEGLMCGNGIRCVGKYLYDNGIAVRRRITVETAAGIKALRVRAENGKAVRLTVDMGEPRFGPEQIPVRLEGEVLDREVEVSGQLRQISCVSMGNPHCVVFVEAPDKLDIAKIGPEIGQAALFPEQTNVEFVQICGRSSLYLRVWERGSGETLACGTGACAAAVAAVRSGRCDPGDVKVRLRGGDLTIRWKGQGNILMAGPARHVFSGVWRVD